MAVKTQRLKISMTTTMVLPTYSQTIALLESSDGFRPVPMTTTVMDVLIPMQKKMMTITTVSTMITMTV